MALSNEEVTIYELNKRGRASKSADQQAILPSLGAADDRNFHPQLHYSTPNLHEQYVENKKDAL